MSAGIPCQAIRVQPVVLRHPEVRRREPAVEVLRAEFYSPLQPGGETLELLPETIDASRFQNPQRIPTRSSRVP
jgi:hypothetical protein